jgi:hypothetical protein
MLRGEVSVFVICQLKAKLWGAALGFELRALRLLSRGSASCMKASLNCMCRVI